MRFIARSSSSIFRSIPGRRIFTARAPFGATVSQVAQGEHFVLLHPHGDAARTIVVAFADRNADAAEPEGVDRVHEQAQPLVERRRPLHVDQCGVECQILIAIAKQRANAPGQRRRQRFQQRHFLRGPAIFGRDVFRVGRH